MDVKVLSDERLSFTDGEVVWSWRPALFQRSKNARKPRQIRGLFKLSGENVRASKKGQAPIGPSFKLGTRRELRSAQPE